MNADAVAALLDEVISIIEVADNRAMAADGPVGHVRYEMSDKEWRDLYVALTKARAALAATPLPSEPCPGCEICVGEIDDCGCVIGHEHTCTPLPSDTPADGLDVERRPSKDYDVGYADGESNHAADWEYAMNEVGGFPDDFDVTPMRTAEAVAELRARLALALAQEPRSTREEADPA